MDAADSIRRLQALIGWRRLCRRPRPQADSVASFRNRAFPMGKDSKEMSTSPADSLPSDTFSDVSLKQETDLASSANRNKGFIPSRRLIDDLINVLL